MSLAQSQSVFLLSQQRALPMPMPGGTSAYSLLSSDDKSKVVVCMMTLQVGSYLTTNWLGLARSIRPLPIAPAVKGVAGEARRGRPRQGQRPGPTRPGSVACRGGQGHAVHVNCHDGRCTKWVASSAAASTGSNRSTFKGCMHQCAPEGTWARGGSRLRFSASAAPQRPWARLQGEGHQVWCQYHPECPWARLQVKGCTPMQPGVKG